MGECLLGRIMGAVDGALLRQGGGGGWVGIILLKWRRVGRYYFARVGVGGCGMLEIDTGCATLDCFV